MTVMGGKWKTYRKIGEDCLNVIGKYIKIGESRSKFAKLIGSSCDYERLSVFLADLRKKYGLTNEEANELYSLYGVAASFVLERGRQLNENVKISKNIWKSQVRYSIEVEKACKINDVLCRRLNVSFFDFNQAEASVEAVGEFMAEVLGWSEKDLIRNVKEARENLKFHF